MSSVANLSALGLNYSPNHLSLPEGSMMTATNVIIRRDNVIESRRGFKNQSQQFSNSVNQLATYRGRILAHSNNRLYYDTGVTDSSNKYIYNQFSGIFQEVVAGLRIKYIQAINNFYFTTSTGIKKISANSASDFTTAAGYIRESGAAKALDFTADLDLEQGQLSGFMPPDTAVAYRHVWAYKDANDNLIIGAPSDRNVVYNFLSEIISLDFNTLLNATDNLRQSIAGYTSIIGNAAPSAFSFSDTYKLSVNSSADIQKSAILAYATALDTQTTIAQQTAAPTNGLQINQFSITSSIARVTFVGTSAGDYFKIGDVIAISGATPTNSAKLNNTTANPYWTISNVDSGGTFIEFSVSGIADFVAETATNAVMKPYTYRRLISTSPQNLNALVISSPATHAQLQTLENAVSAILDSFQNALNGIISANLKDAYLTNLNITQAANVELTISIPEAARTDTNYFVQVYRTRNFTASGTQSLGGTAIQSVEPDDEMRLCFEYYPEPVERTAGSFTFIDQYPEDLLLTNANLYTNPTTGEGIAQSNEQPPIAKDINTFKGYTFFANTKTRQRLTPFQLIGTSNIVDGDKITIGDISGSSTYTFVEGVSQVTPLTFNSTTSSDYLGKYFLIDSVKNSYYVWYRYNNAGTDPAITNRTGIRVDLIGTLTTSIVATKTAAALNLNPYDFYVEPTTYTFNAASGLVASAGAVYSNNGYEYTVISASSTQIVATGTGAPSATGSLIRVSGTGNDTNTYTSVTNPSITVTNIDQGSCTNASIGTMGAALTIGTITPGKGEDAANRKVLLSTLISRAQAIDETARSLVRVINKNSASVVNAYYISSSSTSPGLMNLESKIISDTAFYVMADAIGLGASFNPDISPINVVNNITTAVPGSFTTTLTTATNHGLVNGDLIVISGTSAISSGTYADGVFYITKLNNTHFTIPIVASGTFTAGNAWSKAVDVNVSTNEERANRVYYSKVNQPEAVPLLNSLDIGSQNKQILRIFPLRDSLFVFKEDGLYRISGESAPFVSSLFDSSCVLTAPDSVSIANNIIYGWTTKGISTITEAGVSEVSRPIDTIILKLSSDNYPNFRRVTWGVGYDSDNSYTVYTNSEVDDAYATIGFRYSNLTNTWTNFDLSARCGVLFADQDRLYLGDAVDDSVLVERKTFTREDYADKEFIVTVPTNALSEQNYRMDLSDVSDIVPGDVVAQNQFVSIEVFNNLLSQLDLDRDVGITPISNITAGAAGATVTVTTSVAHGLSPGDSIYIKSGWIIGNSAFEGTLVISNVSSFNFDIVAPAAVTAGSVGTFKRQYELKLTQIAGCNMHQALTNLTSFMNSDPVLTSTYSDITQNSSGDITAVSTAIPPTLTTTSQTLVEDRIVTITGTSGTTPTISGNYTVLNPTTSSFEIDVDIITGNPSIAPGVLTFTTSPNINNQYDLQACFNAIVNRLNEAASGTFFKTYALANSASLFEAVVVSVNYPLNYVILNLGLQWLVGDLTVYKAIPLEWQYAPITFGDPLSLKQIREATIMLESRAYTKLTTSFSSDLKPEFTDIVFEGQGNGIFGHYSNPGFGFGFFGGASNSAPLRTLIPFQNQRCRFINMEVNHRTAREKLVVFGITLTGNVGQSTRAYR